MKRAVQALLAAAFATIANAGDSHPETDGEIWNRGVDEYRAGNLTNALATLRPLILSKTHGGRAAELAGAIGYAEADKRGDDAPGRLAALENAAADFQLALRSRPDDPRMNRNFTRSTDRLPQLREEVHVIKTMEKLGQQSPDALLGAAVKDAQAMMAEFPAALTNDAAKAIARCEALSARAEKLSDTWIAVKAAVAQSVTNEQQAMTINQQVETARQTTIDAVKELADLDVRAQTSLAGAESAFHRFWKLAILPPAACDEAIVAQTNELIAAGRINDRRWQSEALDFARAFRAKFPAWAQAYEQQAQSDTNKPPFTKEAQAEISALATEVEKAMIGLDAPADSAAGKPRKGGGDDANRAVKQFEVLAKLERIRELLPKDGNGGGQNQNNQNNQNDQNRQDGQNNQDGQNDKQPDGDSQENDQPEKSEGEQKPEEKQPESAREEKDDGQVEDMIRKAQERSDEHDAEKKARMKNAPLPPNERDW